MKRSEMLQAIESYTLKMWPELDVIDVAYFAEALLGMQEANGMRDNGWEPEDEPF